LRKSWPIRRRARLRRPRRSKVPTTSRPRHHKKPQRRRRSALAHCYRERCQDQYRIAGGQRLSAAAERPSSGRGDPATGDNNEEGNRETRLIALGKGCVWPRYLRERTTMKFHLRQLALAAALTGASSLAMAADDDWQARVGEALGKTGTAAPGGIYRSEEHT